MEYRRKQNRRPENTIVQISFLVFLYLSVFYFKKWGYWLTSLYAVFAVMGAIGAAGIDDSPFYTSKQAAVYGLLMHFSLCSYLFSRKVRSAFFLRPVKPIA